MELFPSANCGSVREDLGYYDQEVRELGGGERGRKCQGACKSDWKIMTVLKYQLGPILTELKRKFKRFTKRDREEHNFDAIVILMVATVTTAVDHAGGMGGVTEVEIMALNVVIQDMGRIVKVHHHPHEVNGIVCNVGSC
ncbi:hypothetical protein EDC04DRAFT_2608038 [Pisolithus marmoratus]|nr:hypothetical protein EDC04DRAFT_2608038 [Pisolithus marmoratus]